MNPTVELWAAFAFPQLTFAFTCAALLPPKQKVKASLNALRVDEGCRESLLEYSSLTFPTGAPNH